MFSIVCEHALAHLVAGENARSTHAIHESADYSCGNAMHPTTSVCLNAQGDQLLMQRRELDRMPHCAVSVLTMSLSDMAVAEIEDLAPNGHGHWRNCVTVCSNVTFFKHHVAALLATHPTTNERKSRSSNVFMNAMPRQGSKRDRPTFSVNSLHGTSACC